MRIKRSTLNLITSVTVFAAVMGVPGQLDFDPLAQPEAEIIIAGELTGDQVELVALDGDFNGDGRFDPVVSIRPSGAVPQVIVLWENPLPPLSDLPSLSNTTVISNALGECGYADVNGDLIDDLLISNGGSGVAGGLGNGVPSAFVVYGSLTPPATLDLASPPANSTTQIIPERAGPPYSNIPLSIAAAGQFDGVQEAIIIGDGSVTTSTNLEGRCYLIQSSALGPGVPTLNLSSVAFPQGLVINGSSVGEQMGLSVAGRFDINSDGLDDVALTGLNPYVLFGANPLPSAPISIATLGNQGVTLSGPSGPYFLGSPGNLSGLGSEDLLIATQSGTRTLYLLGSSSGIANTVALSTLPSFTDSSTSNSLVPAAGRTADLNNDNLPDLVVSEPVAGLGAGVSSSLVVTNPFNLGLPSDFASLLGREAIRLHGVDRGGATAGDALGQGVGVADVTGDGFPDLLITAPGDDTVNGIDTGALIVIPFTPPAVSAAYLIDIDDDGAPDAGEGVVAEFDRQIVLQTGQITNSFFNLTQGGDTLGSSGFQASAVVRQDHRVSLELGSSPSFSVGGANSAIDVSASGFVAEAIVSRLGVNATDLGTPDVDDGTGADLDFSLVANSASADPGVAAAVGVTNSPDAVYTQHEITIPSTALSESALVSLSTPDDGQHLGSAVRIEITEAVANDGLLSIGDDLTLTMEYREDDRLLERGAIPEHFMRIVEIIEINPGVYQMLPLPGEQTIDSVNNLITVTIPGAGGAGGSLAIGRNGVTGGGLVGTFATLPVETVDERSTWMHPETGGAGGPAVLSIPARNLANLDPESEGTYLEHRVTFPGWETVTVPDSNSVQVTIRTTGLFERSTTLPNQSFPTQSGSVFTIEVLDDTLSPVSFTDDVDIRVQFFERASSSTTDVVDFSSAIGNKYQMRVVTSAGSPVDFDYLSSSFSQAVNGSTDTVTVSDFSPLTGSNGITHFGVVVDTSTVPAGLTAFREN
jgi:FG-GAP repeat protein